MKTPLRRFAGKLRWEAISAVGRRDLPLPEGEPIVSFTFDDFQRSALHIGGTILRNHGVYGTFYAAMSLMDQTNELGDHFCASDLQHLLRSGHELGSHTFSHLSVRSTPIQHFESDLLRGKEAIERLTGGNTYHNFAYPFGHATASTKRRIGSCVSSCRGAVPGVNTSPIDLNLLRANSLYSQSLDLGFIDRLFDASRRDGGWVVFYTHDISERPSPFGCRPGDLEAIVKLAIKSRARILPIGAALCAARSQLTNASSDFAAPDGEIK